MADVSAFLVGMGIDQVRTEIFGADFPASAAITVAGFADPAMMIEIQAVAVAG